jgi:hypothetical protein
MDLQDVTKDMVNQTNYRLTQRMEELMRTNPRYQNLSGANRELIMSLIKKYQDEIRHGLKPSLAVVREDKYKLYENRLKLGLSPEDLAQINQLLDSFKS